MTRHELLQHFVDLYDRCAAAATRASLWWQRWWLWVLGVPLVAGVFIVIQVMWKIAGQPVPGISELFTQMQMVISGTQAVIALVVGLTVMYSARTNAEAARAARLRDLGDAHAERVRRVSTFVGATLDVASYGRVLATLQESGLKQKLGSSRAEEDLRIATWRDLVAASAAASRSLEHLRYTDDEAVDPAEELFAVAREVVGAAARGMGEEIEAAARTIREKANELQTLTRSSRPKPEHVVRPSA